jgi:Sulfotransferase family
MSEPATRPRPVLMTPLQRCGSHAIRLRLAQNQAFYSPHPLNVIDFIPLAEYYGELDDLTYLQLVTDMVGLQNANMVTWPGVAIDPLAIFDAVAEIPRSAHTVFWEIMMQAAEQQGGSVVMDKSCESVVFAEEYLALLPDLHFLNVVRDPRAQVNSINRAIIHDFDSLLNARRWVRAHDMATALAQRHPDRVLTIRYEDFVSTPEPVLRQVCDFLGIEYLDAMLDVGSSKEASTISSRSALWESNSRPPMPAYINKFARQLSREDIEVIETVTAGYMRRYGYELMTPASAPVGDEQLEQARERSAAAREQAWQQLRDRDPRDYLLRRYRAWYLDAVRRRLTGAEAAAMPTAAQPAAAAGR